MFLQCSTCSVLWLRPLWAWAGGWRNQINLDLLHAPHSVHSGRDLQELSLRLSLNPHHMNHCCLRTSVHGHSSYHWIQLAHSLGISSDHTPALIIAVFSKPFSLLLFLGLADLQGESPVTAEGSTAEHCCIFDYAVQEPSKEPCSHLARDDNWYQTPFPLIASK